MAQYGKAYYCDECDAEIVSGDHCSECDPENGSKQITYTFLGNWTSENDMDPVEQSESQSTSKWWQFWR